MDKTDPPTSFGVFKPVGHTVIALRSAAEAQNAVMALLALGFADASVVRYSAAEMQAQVNAQLPAASPLAAFGQELGLAKAHLALAEAGCSFLVVHTPEDAQAEQVAALAHSVKAVAAQRYGLLVIEELIEVPDELVAAAQPTAA
jgi:hypothetical protein